MTEQTGMEFMIGSEQHPHTEADVWRGPGEMPEGMWLESSGEFVASREVGFARQNNCRCSFCKALSEKHYAGALANPDADDTALMLEVLKELTDTFSRFGVCELDHQYLVRLTEIRDRLRLETADREKYRA